MFNVQTINCMQYSELVVIKTRWQSCNEIYTHTEHLVQKHKRSYLVLNEEKRKQGNKKKKLTESLHLTVKIARRLNDNMTLVSETSHKQNHCSSKWKAYQLSAMILHSQFNLGIQFQRQGEILLFTIKTPCKHATDAIQGCDLLIIKWQSC